MVKVSFTFPDIPIKLNIDCNFKRDEVFSVPLVWPLSLEVIEVFVHFGRSQSAGHAFEAGLARAE